MLEIPPPSHTHTHTKAHLTFYFMHESLEWQTCITPSIATKVQCAAYFPMHNIHSHDFTYAC